MPKVKIINQGYEQFSDYLGPWKFEKGVSVDDIPQAEVNRLGAVFNLKSLKGEEVTDYEHSDKYKDTAAPNNDLGVVKAEDRKVEKPEAKKEVAKSDEPVKQEEPITDSEVTKSYTREELDKIADEKGRKAIAEIAEAKGIKTKGVRITTLINKILGE